jgi:5-methyltetrahydrofolate--homocysteine methyltransferase
MSALLVQTSNHMITVSKMMRDQGLEKIPVLIGGAPVNDRHAAYVAMAGDTDESHMRSNVFYCPTAMDGVNVMNTLRSGNGVQPYLDANLTKLHKNYERAEKRAQEEEEMLRTLPRRVIGFEKHRVPDDPYFAYETQSVDLRAFKERIDRKTLFALNWKFGGTASREKQGETADKLNALLDEWVERAAADEWVRPLGICGVFPCQSDGDEVIVYDPEDLHTEIGRFGFTRVIGGERKDTVCAAQYFYPKDSGKLDAIGLQISTSGPQVDAQLKRFRESGDSESTLYLQGLSDRIAEDMADYVHGVLRERFGYEAKHGIRWSPGYPAMTETKYNRTILDLLHATELIGVKITEAGEFSPTGTTAAVVCFHPDAHYT